MALRLTDSAGSRRPDPSRRPAPAPATAPAVLLAARAEAALGARDLDGYRALFADAAKVEDVHRRYEARKRLIEVGLGAKGGSLAAIAPVFAAVAESAVSVLEAEPREPILLQYAGVVFYELGELKAAEALFKAAVALDPELPHIDANLDEIARRRRVGLTSIKLPANVAPRLKQIAERACRVARVARPRDDQRISLCMIVKDEEAMLGRTLAAVADHVDEIIVVDTGSTDRTVEIAAEHGATILHHTWTGDFAAARNVSLEAATGDWILYLDADEVLVDGDGPALRALAGKTWREAFYLVWTNHTGDEEDGTAVQHNGLRMFRNRPQYRFEGRLHEQYAQHLPGFLKERLELTQVRVDHFGYLGVVRDEKAKSARNIELITKQIAEGTSTPFLRFNLGTELAAAGEAEASLEEFRTAWHDVTNVEEFKRLGFVPSLGNRLVKMLRACGHLEEALTVAEDVLERLPGFTDVVLEQALVNKTLGDTAKAEALLRRCLEMGDAPSRYTATVGCGTYWAQLALAELLREQGRTAEAEALVVQCLAEHPTFLGVVEPYASTRLACGAPVAEVVAAVYDAVPQMSPAARFNLAVALHEQGAFAEAEHELAQVVAARPDNAPARLALVETLLSQARFADAAEAAAAVPEDSPLLGAAVRARAFAALAEGDAETAAAVLADADTVPDPERAALAAWQAVLAGGEPAPLLPAEAADSVVVMLEALARVEAFDAFELLAGRLDTLDLPWREKRERLAGVYLRRGFVDLAADEWLTVCEAEGPDAPAMIGLAQVAWAKGLAEDAIAFAEEAQAIDPTDPTAGLLAERLAAAVA